MLLFREEAIFASSTSKIWEMMFSNSISTSLIHSVASVGKPEQEHTFVLKPIH